MLRPRPQYMLKDDEGIPTAPGIISPVTWNTPDVSTRTLAQGLPQKGLVPSRRGGTVTQPPDEPKNSEYRSPW